MKTELVSLSKTEVVPLCYRNDDYKIYSSYIVKLKNKANDEYYVTLYPQAVDVCDTPNMPIKDKKIAKFVANELMTYLHNSIAPAKYIIKTIEGKIKRTENDIEWLMGFVNLKKDDD